MFNSLTMSVIFISINRYDGKISWINPFKIVAVEDGHEEDCSFIILDNGGDIKIKGNSTDAIKDIMIAMKNSAYAT